MKKNVYAILLTLAALVLLSGLRRHEESVPGAKLYAACGKGDGASAIHP